MFYSVWQTIVEAFIAGITLSLLLGPAFFTLLQTSLERGFRAAFWIAEGVFLSDACLVAISFLGASRLFANPTASKIIGLVGGTLLVLIGLYTFRKKVIIIRPSLRTNNKLPETPAPGRYFLKGFFMNMANPGTWLFWFVSVGAITAQYTTEDGHVVTFRVLLFFLITLSTVFSMDILKSFIANKIKGFINARTVRIINKVVGGLLMLFGLYLLLSSFIPLNIDSVTGSLRLN